ncbi:hypothetical protein ACQ5SK_45700 [Bradyrhizobium japonicum]
MGQAEGFRRDADLAIPAMIVEIWRLPRGTKMCESPTIKGRTGWRGWSELPTRAIQKTDEKWVDLTYPFSISVPRSAAFPPPKFSYFAQMPERPLQCHPDGDNRTHGHSR